MKPHDPRTLIVKFSKPIDLFNMRYLPNTVGEHRTETRSNPSGYNEVFLNKNRVISPKSKFPLLNPHNSSTLTVKFSKSMDLFNMIYSTNKVGEHRTETRSNTSGYNGVLIIQKPSNFVKNKNSPDEPP